MSSSSKLNYLHYVMLTLLAIVSIQGGQYCGSMSFTLLGLACTGLELAFLSGPKRGHQTRQSMRWPLIIGGSILAIPGFLYVIAEMANSEPGSPRYPVSLGVCGLFAVGFTVWLILAVYASLPDKRIVKLPVEQQAFQYKSKSRLAAGIVLLLTLTCLSGALRASAIFEPTKLVVYGIFPWQDRAHLYTKLATIEPVSFSYKSGTDTKAEPGFRIVFSDGGMFDLGPTWSWLCPRDKETVDNRIMALLQPHMANLFEKVQGRSSPTPARASSEPPVPRDYGINVDLPIPAQIDQLNAYLKAHPEPFDSYGHNVLRHLYLAVDERKAMEECDLIFAHSFMDDYTLQCLSDWMLDKQPDKAIKNLMLVCNKYPDLKFLNAACTLEIARLYKQLNKSPDASRFLAALVNEPDTDLSAYRAAAERPE